MFRNGPQAGTDSSRKMFLLTATSPALTPLRYILPPSIPACAEWCHNQCELLNGDVESECGSCPQVGSGCHPGSAGYMQRVNIGYDTSTFSAPSEGQPFTSRSHTGGQSRNHDCSCTNSDGSITDIEELHRCTVSNGKQSYVDPSTGYNAMSQLMHQKRGYCCGNGCRHCPYGHVNVNPRRKSTITAPLTCGLAAPLKSPPKRAL